MSAFLTILGVPLMGALLYSAELMRRAGETPRARSLGRSGVLLCGAILSFFGLFVVVETAMWIISGVLDRSVLMAVLAFVTQSTAGLLMLLAGCAAWRVYRLPLEAVDHTAESRQERISEQLRLSAALLMCVPLLLLGAFSLLLVVPLVLWGVGWRTARLGRQAQFLWTLALAVKQDLPLAEEIEMFAQPLWSRQRGRYQTLAVRLRDGRSLGEALELSWGVLPRSVACEIRMAEEAGRLAEVLTELAANTSTSLRRYRADGSVAITILYGWLLLSVFLFIISFLKYWIIRKYKAIFADFDFDLPPLTVSVINASDLFIENFLLVMPLIGLPLAVAIAVSYVYFASWGNLNLPLLMRWFPRLDAPLLLRSLSHAVEAGRPLPRVVDEMSHRHLRSDVRQRLVRIGQALQRGEPLWAPLREEGFLHRAEAEALAAAQRAGNLPWAMRTLADSMNRTLQRRAQFWLEIIKPAIVVGVGLIVGWFVIAMFLPLVRLITALA